MLDVNGLIVQIQKAGVTKVRVVPMNGQPFDGQQCIEARGADDSWTTLATGVPKSIAEDIVAKATNRVICG